MGLGSRVSAVTSIYTQGALNATDSTTDFAINGDGFFAVRNTNTDETGIQEMDILHGQQLQKANA